MTLTEFNGLNLKDQMEITWANGVIEDNRVNKNYHYIVYKVYDFFVEMALNRESEEIVQIRGFE